MVRVKTEYPMIGGQPHHITSFKDICDIEVKQSSQRWRDFLTDKHAILLYHPIDAVVNTYPGFTIAININQTDIGCITYIAIRTNTTNNAILAERQ